MYSTNASLKALAVFNDHKLFSQPKLLYIGIYRDDENTFLFARLYLL